MLPRVLANKSTPKTPTAEPATGQHADRRPAVEVGCCCQKLCPSSEGPFDFVPVLAISRLSALDASHVGIH
jgi:hypothetical protein